ncbi:MAG: ribonuclease J [Natronospirillum sp.]|uniref:ribonuclease J n=1 Tax=Natronospirillum sp. TaxID=2812955 RepID=UPI00260098FC|nr:ribonuclease J [Natronospirillum sp.]MCH8550379.1 ribonuclease J [Natronospirillum sp.]
MTPNASDLWFLPLGGCGEIGMNLNLYGHDGQWLMVDCGVTFAAPDAPVSEPHVQMADPRFIEDRRDALVGLVVTHAHEDHIGGVAHLWPRLRCPVFTTPFAAEILRRKLGEVGLDGVVPVIIVPPGEQRFIGAFNVEWIDLTHSIPEPSALMLRTPAGNIFHTADWKLDPNPVLGKPYDPATYQRLGTETIDAMVCDSTNATLAGHSASELSLEPGLREVISSAQGRVVVTCFASNLARLVTLARIARETGRHLSLFGRSLNNMVSAARATGIWPEGVSFVPPRDLGYFPRDTVMAIATGSQGESRAALSRLARDRHPYLSLDPGDRVVFSARIIPGNEREVERLIAQLRQQEVEVITSEAYPLPIHASGHPAEDELRAMYDWIQPEIAIPVHGEAAHIKANADIARACGIPRQLQGQNGDLFFIAPMPGVRRGAAPTGRLGLQGELLRSL